MEESRNELQQGELGLTLIRQERLRQINAEGWTPEHDDEHTEGELVNAAIAYLTSDITESIDCFWPWDRSYWKPVPDDRIRELEKAGALIAAEIDRLSRLPKEESDEH